MSSYPACKAHASYYTATCGPSGSTIFFYIDLINGRIFGKNVIEYNLCFGVSLKLLSEAFLILRRIQRHITINVHRASCKVPIILVGF